jgi:hypothetical protein
MAAIVSSRRWSAIVTGPNCHISGNCSAYRRAEQLRPAISTIGRQAVSGLAMALAPSEKSEGIL